MEADTYLVIQRAIRPAIQAWWRKLGVWLAAALLINYGVSIGFLILLQSGLVNLPGVIGFSSYHDIIGLLLLGVLWLMLACEVNRRISTFLDQQATPVSPEILVARFLLCYKQGLPLLLAVMILSWCWHLNIGNNSSHLGITGSEYVRWIFESGETCLHYYMPLALAMIWLTGLLALAPGHQRLAWIILFAWISTMLPYGSFLPDLYGPYSIHSIYYLSFGWVIGVLLMFFFFNALRLQQWKAVRTLAYVLASGMFVVGFFSCLGFFFGIHPLPRVANLFWQFCDMLTACPFSVLPLSPNIVLELLDLILLPIPHPDKLHPAVHFFATLIWLPGWIYLAHLLMHRVILRRAPSTSNADEG